MLLRRHRPGDLAVVVSGTGGVHVAPPASTATICTESGTLLADRAVDDVPVVDGDGRLVSVSTRHDLLSARMALLDHETLRPGWLTRRRFRPADDLAHGRAS